MLGDFDLNEEFLEGFAFDFDEELQEDFDYESDDELPGEFDFGEGPLGDLLGVVAESTTEGLKNTLNNIICHPRELHLS